MKQRIITAIVGISIGLVIVFLSDTIIFPIAVAFISAYSVYELLNVCRMRKYPVHFAGCLVFTAAMPFLAYFRVDYGIRYVIVFITVFVMFAGYVGDHKKLPFEKLCVMIAVTALISLSVTCIISLKNIDDVHGIIYVVMALMAAWLPDGGAYFVGTALGKHKLCPDISPKKTVEGAIGGAVVSVIVFVIFAVCYQSIMAARGVMFTVNYPLLIIAVLVCAVIAIVGDLSASLIKRENELKNFGNLMPGHGGIVDRFDSVYFILPFLLIIFSVFDVFPAA
ncbi:MAG: phosphatidate cytidylyltransferase [Oscillospiraceae bacterium]|nr:phosphatidate cytidylyltransferase [Oscillospiraceae bacterium]